MKKELIALLSEIQDYIRFDFHFDDDREKLEDKIDNFEEDLNKMCCENCISLGKDCPLNWGISVETSEFYCSRYI